MLQEWYRDCLPTEPRRMGSINGETPSMRNSPAHGGAGNGATNSSVGLRVDASRESRIDFNRFYNDTAADCRVNGSNGSHETVASLVEADYFILMRPDLILKQNLSDIWNLHKESVAFTFAGCLGDMGGCRKSWTGKCWRVADRLVAMPRRAFEIVRKRKIYVGHGMYKDLVNMEFPYRLILWSDASHNADPQWDLNPYYEIAGRASAEVEQDCKHRRDYLRRVQVSERGFRQIFGSNKEKQSYYYMY